MEVLHLRLANECLYIVMFGVGLEVYSLGFCVNGSGLRVKCLGFRVIGLGVMYHAVCFEGIHTRAAAPTTCL